MSKLLFFILALVVSNTLIGQTSNRQLQASEIEQLLTKELKAKLNIDFPIYRTYEYQDKLGLHYLILAEHPNGDGKRPEHNDSIKAFSFLKTGSNWQFEWQLKDFILPEGNANSKEYSIWFWSKYLSLMDIDNDGIIEPIIIYGTSGMNGTNDGRIKILTYYKGNKKAIRHHNGVLDWERKTQVDELFYQLPNSIQIAVISIMDKITTDQNVIFPVGWEAAMESQKLNFNEN